MDSVRADVTLRVLGRFSVSVAGRPRALRPSARRLVAVITVRGPASRSNAAGLLWPDLPQDRALGNLRTALWRVRQDAPGLLAEDGEVLGVAGAQVDFVDVRTWAWRALRGEEPWTPVPESVALDLLPGWEDDWLVLAREEMRLLQLHALESAAQRLLTAGRCGEAAGVVAGALTLDPLRESANRLLVEIYLREENRWDALRHFRKYESLLRHDVGVDPSPSLAALVAPLLSVRLASRPVVGG
jgi:DNA-binding SARP family transcriptional activator